MKKLLLIFTLITVLASPAFAIKVSKGNYKGKFSFEINTCGFPLNKPTHKTTIVKQTSELLTYKVGNGKSSYTAAGDGTFVYHRVELKGGYLYTTDWLITPLSKKSYSFRQAVSITKDAAPYCQVTYLATMKLQDD